MKSVIFSVVLFLILANLNNLFGEEPSQPKDDEVNGWVAKHWIEYSGVYDWEVESTSNERVVLTAFLGANGAQLFSACVITVEDTYVEPIYQVFGGISSDVETGSLSGPGISGWRMIQFEEPETGATRYGIWIDGRILIDDSKTRQ